MFIVGVVIGPAIGVLAGDYLFGPGGPGLWLSLAAIALFIVFLLFAPFFVLELKIGLIVGVLLGVLLATTPMTADLDNTPA